MLPQRRSEGTTAVCLSERDVGHLPPFSGAGLTGCPALPPPRGGRTRLPLATAPTDTPCHHPQVEHARASLSGVPLRLCPAAASRMGHSNPCPFAISRKRLSTEPQRAAARFATLAAADRRPKAGTAARELRMRIGATVLHVAVRR